MRGKCFVPMPKQETIFDIPMITGRISKTNKKTKRIKIWIGFRLIEQNTNMVTSHAQNMFPWISDNCSVRVRVYVIDNILIFVRVRLAISDSVVIKQS